MRTSVGLDISKKTIDAAYMPAERQITSAVFTNDADGIQSLKQWLDAFGQSDLHICMEATGNYYEAAADALSNDYAVYVVNPLKIKCYAKKRFSRTKTDKQDAKIIAEYCFTALDAELEQRHTPSADQYRLKRFMALHGQLKQQMTAQKNRLKAAKDKFVQSIHKEQIAQLQRHIDAVEQEINDAAVGDSGTKATTDKLQSIPGIGVITSAKLAYYLTALKFKGAKQFAAFAGLVPQKKESGTSVKGKEQMTNYGNRQLRGALFMPAMVAYRNGYFPELIKRLTKKKKPKKVIIGAIMRKLATIAYYVHTTGKPYEPHRYRPQS
nr:MAG TPA: transposase [Inoviridae sp.]